MIFCYVFFLLQRALVCFHLCYNSAEPDSRVFFQGFSKNCVFWCRCIIIKPHCSSFTDLAACTCVEKILVILSSECLPNVQTLKQQQICTLSAFCKDKGLKHKICVTNVVCTQATYLKTFSDIHWRNMRWNVHSMQSQIRLFHLLKYEYFLVVLFFCDSKLNVSWLNKSWLFNKLMNKIKFIPIFLRFIVQAINWIMTKQSAH